MHIVGLLHRLWLTAAVQQQYMTKYTCMWQAQQPCHATIFTSGLVAVPVSGSEYCTALLQGPQDASSSSSSSSRCIMVYK
jgi:hypothetical protein